ncbi:uncharacterized protein LOC103179114 [Callorhinchus milii]|nr:uncharacterized protein LOC103179114 [Callorhinchus milii]|eukprot:gi/632953420/ref/XP_007892407.1/ PREDICTED: uncharacterized protein LOC103179114 [Callorhinchus milii]
MPRSAAGDSLPLVDTALSGREEALFEDLKKLEVLPERAFMPNVPNTRPPKSNTPLMFEARFPSPERVGKGIEVFDSLQNPISPPKDLQIKSESVEDPIDTCSRWHEYSPGRESKTSLKVKTSPNSKHVEEHNISVNSAESLLDFHNAKDESESLLRDKPKETSIRMSFSPWTKLLNMYSRMKKSPIPKLQNKESSQELLREEGQRIQLILYRYNDTNPLIFSHFRTTDSVGFVEMEIKKMLDVQNEICLWKRDSNEETRLLQRSDVTLQDAGIHNEQILILEEKDLHGGRP